MPIVPAVSIGSVNTGATTDPTAIVLQDISTGSDGAIASRSVSLYTVQNVLLVAPIPWPLATNPITIKPLTQDIALNAITQWLDGSGNVLYTLSQITPFTGFGETFWYNLIQTESSNPAILQDVNYQNYKATLRNYLDSAVQAISIGQNLGNSQAMILKASYLITNSDKYY
jgi:hypothetical protein